MMTSSTQYLQPEFLPPTASSQDAKSSPLAMLMATCNSIGGDAAKLTLDSNPKPKPHNEPRSGRVSSNSNASNHGYSPSKDKSGNQNTSSSAYTDISPKERLNSDADRLFEKKSDLDHVRSSPRSNKSTDVTRLSPNFKSKHESDSIALPAMNSSSPVRKPVLDLSKPSSSHSFPSLPHYSAAHMSMAGLQGLPGYPYSLLGSSGLASLMAAHKHNADSVKYTPVRTASGATTLIPLCSDPYCSHCKLTLQAAQLSPMQCTAGCVQCTHDKSLGLPPNYSHTTPLSSGLLGLHGLGRGMPGLPPASLLPPSGGGGGHVCSWIAPGSDSGVCGKRFTTSEELMTHLRTHTTPLPVSTSSVSSASSLLSSSAALAAAYQGLGATPNPSTHLLHGSALSPASFRQAYSGRLSPGLLSAASRYHPYLKSSLASSMTSPPETSALGALHSPMGALHPSLGAYSSLYSLYAHKLGVP